MLNNVVLRLSILPVICKYTTLWYGERQNCDNDSVTSHSQQKLRVQDSIDFDTEIRWWT